MIIVVAAIALLVALLASALDSAVYQAGLASCAANLKTIANGQLTYAAEHQRAYAQIRGQDLLWEPSWIAASGNGLDTAEAADLRSVFEGYISAKSLVCPLSPRISLAAADTGTSAFVCSSYNLWTGWQYKMRSGPAEQGMFRVGDRWTWSGSSFRAIAADVDYVGTNGSTTNASHGDDAEVMIEYRFQRENSAMSGWVTGNSANPDGVRGRLDTNMALDDGSVHRFSGVKTVDERMKRVSCIRDGNGPNSTRNVWINVSAR